jgi:hypothetical protein
VEDGKTIKGKDRGEEEEEEYGKELRERVTGNI